MKPNQEASYLEYKSHIYMNQETQSFESINPNHWEEIKRPCHAVYVFLMITPTCARDIIHLSDLYPSKALVSCLDTFVAKRKRALQNVS